MTLTEKPAVIQVHQQTEYDPLRSVVMCLANPFDRDPTALFANGDEAMEYQAARNRARPYDVDRVHTEQHAFISVMRGLGVEVLLAQPVGECISQHFPRDIGFVIGDVFVVARPRRAYRDRELAGLDAILPQLSRVIHLDEGCIEGGDVFVNGNEVIVGYGEETNPAGVAALQRALELNGVQRTMITLDLAERGAIHTDCKFNIIGKNLAIANLAALTPESLRLVEKRFSVIPATPEETMDVSINTLVIGDRKLVMSTGAQRLANEVAKHGIDPILLDYSEVNALPGSFRCTTLPLIRAY